MTLNYTPEQTKMLVLQAMEDPVFVAKLKKSLNIPGREDYCTQNNGHCEICALVNYGKDCRNNPIPKGCRNDRNDPTTV